MKNMTIARIITIILFLVLTLAMAGLGAYNYVDTRGRMLEDIESLGDNIAYRFQLNLINPMWNLETQQGVKIIDSEMASRHVYAVLVKESETSTFAARIRDDKWEITNYQGEDIDTKNYILVTQEITKDDKVLGTAEIYLTKRFVNEQLSSLLVATIIAVVVIDALIILILYLFMRAVFIKPVVQLQDFARSVGMGDLDAEPPAKDFVGELGQLKVILTKMVGSLKDTIEEVRVKEREAADEAKKAEESARIADEAREQAVQSKREGMVQAAETLEGIVMRLSSSSEELSHQVEHVRDGSGEQLHRINGTATSMDEMNQTVLEVAQNASDAAEQAAQTQEQAAEGKKVVSQAVDSINNVNQIAENLRENMSSLEQKAEAIGQVINVIQDIADQTNLLALNAAIEAARAGEAGRGFAVVADEVRKLAEKTMQATKEVVDSITAIQSETQKSLSVTMEVGTAVQGATELAEKASQSLDTIVGLVEVTSDQIRRIATAAEEQSASTEHINSSIEQINQIAQVTNDDMHHASQAIAEVAEQASELNNLIGELKAGE